MADDRYNDPFAIWDFSMGWSQWPVAGTELWAPLISGNSRMVRPVQLSNQAVGFLSTTSQRELGSG